MGYDVKDLIKKVLKKGYLISLATTDDGGPWVSDLIYIYDDNLNIYWMSDPDVRHSKAILNNSEVAGSITANHFGEDNLGVQIEGIAEKIEGQRYDLAKKHFLKRNRPIPKENEDVLQGNSWYVLKPTKIELIDEKLFGFDKKVLNPQE